MNGKRLVRARPNISIQLQTKIRKLAGHFASLEKEYD